MTTNELLLCLLNLATYLALSSGAWPFTRNDEITYTTGKQSKAKLPVPEQRIIRTDESVTSCAMTCINSRPLPPFTFESYEVRTYPAGNWVCKNYTGSDYGVRQVSNSFYALYNYASGANSDGVSLEIKVPVIANIVLNVNAQNYNLYQMCFYLPPEYQNKPPMPSAEGVFIRQRKGLTVAARKFNAFFSTSSEFGRQTRLLIDDLMANKEENMDFTNYYGAVYDPPFTINARSNEVWIAKKD